jgi:ferredoxin
MNEVIRPHLFIVDGLIAKEGQGPAWGEPKRLDILLAGTSPFLMDAFCARLIGFELDEIEYLKIAVSKGHLMKQDVAKLNEVRPLAYLKRATPQRFVNFLALPVLDPIRNFVRPFTDVRLISAMLYLFRIREDMYVQKDAKIDKMYVDRNACNRCEHCLDFCPMGLPLTQEGFDFDQSDCIKCLYCYFICPREAIVVEGDLGFLERAAKDYGENIRRLVAS